MNYLVKSGTVEGLRSPTVLINCENGESCGKWVKHVFVEERQLFNKDLKPILGKEVIYACSKCKYQRRFGLIQK